MSTFNVTFRRLCSAVTAGVAITTVATSALSAAPAYATGTPKTTAAVTSDYSCVDPGIRDKEDENWFGRAQRAYGHVIHRSERGGLMPTREVLVNSAYVNVSKERMEPISGTKYLWLVNQDDDLILGIEKASDYPGGFEPGAAEYYKSRKLGHPTLAVRFTKSGRAVEGRGRIAGELYEIDGQWTIDTNSGRYSRGRQEDQNLLLGRAAQLFGELGLTVQCKGR